MFLDIAYGIFLMQIGVILALILPVSIKFKKHLIDLISMALKNFYVKITMIVVMVVMFGLYCENFMTSHKYSDIKGELDESLSAGSLMGMGMGKQEILIKMFRAQRNMYLTFFVNFGWIIIYGLHKFILTIFDYETKLAMIATNKQSEVKQAPSFASNSNTSDNNEKKTD
jgi:hypothetical protein